MPTFTDFLQTHPEVDGLSTDEKFYAEEIFNILNADGQIEKAIQASKNGKSALSASIDKIEKYVNEHRDSDFVLFDFNGDDNLKKSLTVTNDTSKIKIRNEKVFSFLIPNSYFLIPNFILRLRLCQQKLQVLRNVLNILS